MSLRTLPTGTVTFLFSDMERSTQLVQELGPSVFRGVIAQHHSLLREAFEANGGTERGTEGDSFLVVFSEAGAAIDAAIQAQIAVAGASWPENARIRVRMGIHTGQGILGGDDYIGLDINRAARIASAAHGGQVLVSDVTRALLADRLSDGARLNLLGSYRLKDLPGPERLWQLEIRGLPTAFPPLRALDVRRAHLPLETTTFIGRVGELDQIGRLLVDHRLVTLTGPGGSGKSRLALRAAARAADDVTDGAYFIGLAPVKTAGQLPAAIASALGLPDDGGRTPEDVLTDWLRERDVMLVLDNLEQIEEAGQIVDGLLAAAPTLRVLATSRSRLHVAGEQEFPVLPFLVPGRDAEPGLIETSDAVRLFLDRARLVRPDLSPDPAELPIIAEICSRLDGLPLAIELAAARVRLLPLAAIRDRLGHRLDALVDGPSNVPERQQSLRAAIAWSHELLDESERALFRRLAVFVGGWTIEAAESICGGPTIGAVETTLEALADQSLIKADTNADDAHFLMLETIGEFAHEKLQGADELPELRARHGRFFRQLADEAAANAGGPAMEAWFDRLDRDLDNLRAAIGWAFEDGNPTQALGIAAALRPFWLQRNHGAEGLRTLVWLTDRVGQTDDPEYAEATLAAAAIGTWLGDYPTARRVGELSVEAYRRSADRRGLADAIGTLAFATIEVDPNEALALNEESLAAYRELGDVRGEGQALLGRATALFALGRLAETRESLERSLELLQQAGDGYFALFCSIFLGRIKLLTGDAAAGMALYRSVLETSRNLDLRIGIAAGLEYLAEVAVWAGDLRRAVRLGATAARVKDELGGGVPGRIGGAVDPLAAGQDGLPPDVFERESAIGRDADIDTAVAEALAVEAPIGGIVA